MDSENKISCHFKLYFWVVGFIWILSLCFIGFQYKFLFSHKILLLIMICISFVISTIAYVTTKRLLMEIILEHNRERIRIKKQLTNDINHELKTPVASMQVCLETLLSNMNLDDEKRQDMLERCYSHNQRLIKLLATVSLLTRLEDGSKFITKEPVLINTIINDLIEELKIMPISEKINLNINFNEEVIVNGNISLICSIFSNLTQNTILYSECKNLYISLLENNERYCKILFADDGNGVDEKQISHLFERFYRLDKGRSRELGGTGLGLAIVKHAVQFHGGTIKASKRKEKGLQFVFTLKKI